MEHEHRLLDLARRGAYYHSLINVARKTTYSPIGHYLCFYLLIIYLNGANQYLTATIRKNIPLKKGHHLATVLNVQKIIENRQKRTTSPTTNTL